MNAAHDQPLTIALLSSQINMDYLLPALRAAAPGATLRTQADLGPLDTIDAVVCWAPPAGLMAQMPSLQLVQSVGAGVDHILSDPQLPAVPVCRIVDPDMASGMQAYVVWAVTHQQRHMPAYLVSAAQREWAEHAITPPRQHRVGIAGLGTLGLACAQALLATGYAVRGWSRSAKTGLPAGLQGFHGDAQRAEFLAGCDTLVCLLPLTPQTAGVLNAELFNQLPRGAHLVNVGRGDHLVEADLLAALASGQLASATLDAFSVEPLPPAHAFWDHARITITPHIATRTQPGVIAQQTLANLAQVRAGHAAAVAIDRERGY